MRRSPPDCRPALTRFATMSLDMSKYECQVCGHIYDPNLGDAASAIPPGVPFENLPEDWVCPDCGAAKSLYRKVEA